MPLHRQKEVLAAELDRLDRSVGVLRTDVQAFTEPIDGLVVVALRVGRSPISAASRVPGTVLTPMSRTPRCPADARNDRSTSGRCWCRVPPSATLSTCAPRQMPSTGMPRRIAPRSARTPCASRSRLASWPRRWPDAVLAVAGRVHVASAGDDQPVEPIEHASAIGSTGCGGRSTAVPPARPHPRGRWQAESWRAHPRPRSAPAADRWSGTGRASRLRFSGQSRSKPRTLSQSVTAASNAVEFDAGIVEVVLDDVVAERLAGELGVAEQRRGLAQRGR